jgi:hypothetical protein
VLRPARPLALRSSQSLDAVGSGIAEKPRQGTLGRGVGLRAPMLPHDGSGPSPVAHHVLVHESMKSSIDDNCEMSPIHDTRIKL